MRTGKKGITMNAQDAYKAIDDLNIGETIAWRIREIIKALTGQNPKDENIIPFRFPIDNYKPCFVLEPLAFAKRTEGIYSEGGVYLSDNYDWRIYRDDQGEYCLICFPCGKAPRRSDV